MSHNVITEEALKLTFQAEHNPNCPEPFLVRLVTLGALDKLEAHETKDCLGYGKTFNQAFRAALAVKEGRDSKRRLAHRQAVRDLREMSGGCMDSRP